MFTLTMGTLHSQRLAIQVSLKFAKFSHPILTFCAITFSEATSIVKTDKCVALPLMTDVTEAAKQNRPRLLRANTLYYLNLLDIWPTYQWSILCPLKFLKYSVTDHDLHHRFTTVLMRFYYCFAMVLTHFFPISGFSISLYIGIYVSWYIYLLFILWRAF